MTNRPRLCAIRLAFIGVVLTAQATAQPTSADADDVKAISAGSVDAEQRAIDIGRSAVELFDEAHFSAALERFEAAERLAHSPVFVLYMARCSAKLGHWLDARKRLSDVVSEPISEASPVAWQAAHSSAVQELPEASAHVASVKIEIFGARGSWVVEVDGRAVAPPTAGPLELDPGQHHFFARDSLGHTAATTLDLEAGTRKVTLDLNRGDLVQRRERPTPKQTMIRQNRGLSIGLLSVGAASVVTAAVTGIMSWSETNDIKSRCVGVHCLTSDLAKAKRATTLATISTSTLIVGGVSSAAGGLLWFLSPSVTVQQSGAAEAGVTLSGRF